MSQHNTYREIWEYLDGRTSPLHDQHRNEVRTKFKRDAESSMEARETRYMQETYPGYEERWQEAAKDFIKDVMGLRERLEAQAYGKPSSEHIIGLANVPSDKLPEVLATARTAGDMALQRSVIAVARQRGERALVNGWVSEDPGRSAAAEELNRIPETDRLENIAKGHKVPRARTEELAPDPAEIDRQVSAQAAQEGAKAAFFNRPRRMVGRRSERV